MMYVKINVTEQDKMVLWERFPSARKYLHGGNTDPVSMPLPAGAALRTEILDLMLTTSGRAPSVDRALKNVSEALANAENDVKTKMAEKRISTRRDLRARGLVPVEVWVHRSQKRELRSFAKALNARAGVES